MRVFSLLLLVSVAFAQPSLRLIYVNSAPSGSCSNAAAMQRLISTGHLYSCTGGTWTDITAGGGSGTVTVVGAGNLINTAIVTGGGAQAVQTPSATTTLDSSGNIVTPGGISTGVGGPFAGHVDLVQGTDVIITPNSFGFGAPTTYTTALRIIPSNTSPPANSIPILSAPVANESTMSYSSANVLTANLTWKCPTTSGSGTTYSCTPTLLDGTPIPSSLLAAPVAGQVLILIPDVGAAGTAATLSIDGSTTKTIKKGMAINASGDLNSTSDLVAGRGVTLVLNSSQLHWLIQGIGKYTSTGGTLTVTQSANTYNFEIATPNLTGTTGSIGGGLLTAGTCATGTATVTGATTSMVCSLPQGAVYPGDGFELYAYVSAANTVTVKVCALVALTPTATTYNVRVIQ